MSTGCTSPAADDKNLSWSQSDTPQPCMWLLRSTQQTEVDIRDSPTGYLVTPHFTQGDLKSLVLKVVEPSFTIGLDPCRSVWSSRIPSAMFCPPTTLCNTQLSPMEAATVQNYLSQQPRLTYSHSTPTFHYNSNCDSPLATPPARPQ